MARENQQPSEDTTEKENAPSADTSSDSSTWLSQNIKLCPHGRHEGAVCIPCAEEAGGNLSVELSLPSWHEDVHSPHHYTVGGFETIDVIEAKLTPEEFVGYLKGAAMKYLLRCNYKDHHDKDVSKAAWYTARLEKFLSTKKDKSL